MKDEILVGQEHKIIEIPQATWIQHLNQIPKHSQTILSFMTYAHHQVRYFVVKEMVNTQKPIEPEYISKKLNMPLKQVYSILDDLERKLFFLVRNDQGAVAWAYPVTVEHTPYKMDFNSSERLYGA